MADNNEEVLRRSLDAVDRHRNRLLVGVVLTAVVLLLALMFVTTDHSGNTNRFLHHVVIVLATWTTMLALFVVIQITVMTKRILRAIELASKK